MQRGGGAYFFSSLVGVLAEGGVMSPESRKRIAEEAVAVHRGDGGAIVATYRGVSYFVPDAEGEQFASALRSALGNDKFYTRFLPECWRNRVSAG